MKTFKFMKVVYVATYLGIIVLAAAKIVAKVRGCPCGKCKEKRPLFESAESARPLNVKGGANIPFADSVVLSAENSGYRNREMNVFVGEPNLGKRLCSLAQEAGKVATGSSREVTLERHREMDRLLANYENINRKEQSIRNFLDA